MDKSDKVTHPGVARDHNSASKNQGPELIKPNCGNDAKISSRVLRPNYICFGKQAILYTRDIHFNSESFKFWLNCDQEHQVEVEVEVIFEDLTVVLVLWFLP